MAAPSPASKKASKNPRAKPKAEKGARQAPSRGGPDRDADDMQDALVLPRQPQAPLVRRGPLAPPTAPRVAAPPTMSPAPTPPVTGAHFTASRQAAGQASAPAAILTEALTKTYGTRTVVDKLSIAVPRGKVVGFVGPNGAGKTTTIRMLLGLVRPTSGRATVLGAGVDRPTAYLPRVGALIESPAFHANLSGRANLLVHCRLGGHDPARIPPLLAQVGLAERGDEPYKRYSLGMKQRLGIAAALLPDPELIILDEPTNGLDPAGIHEVRDFLRSLGDQGKTVFVSSHLLSEIEKMCDYVVMMRRGKLVFQGSLEELAARGAGLTLVPEKATDAPRLRQALAAAGHAVDASTEGRIVVRGVPPRQGAALNRFAQGLGITLQELSSGSGDLEQAFLAMTEDDHGDDHDGGHA